MKKESLNFLFENEIKWEYPSEGVSRQIMGYNDDMMMVKVKFDTGAIGTQHKHPHTQTTYVVSGIFEFTTDGETKIVRPGDGVYMKPGVMHGCVCVEEGILIDTFAPIREDFL
ncbi:MAG: cupin domain-containing protein [Bacteroides sp.]|nr:cupin domain-containing protein [Bacteroides sp.]